ncbi:methyltransferase domain-containing protein [soil metagenome]
MTSTYASSDDLRVRVWLEIREPLERQLEPLGRAAMSAIRPLPGERVLDIGCGIGGTPLALARLVGPSGGVVGMDLLQAAIDVARRDPGLPENVTFLCGDAQSHPLPEGSFDAAFSRFGVMFFADRVAAFGNIRQALRPGGRLGFVCWRGFDDNELDELPLRAASSCLPPSLVADAAASAWFSFSDRESIREVLTAAGFTDVTIVPHDEAVRCGDLQSTVDVCSRVGALGKILRDHPELRSAAVAALEQALRPLDSPNGPALRAATWVVTARAAG